jgi:putative peptidoglycan lipid II flippase
MRSGISLGLLAGGNIIIAFLFQFAIITVIGPGHSTDAFFAAGTIPQTLIATFSVVLSSVLIPIFSGEHTSRQNEDAWNYLYFFGLVLSGIALLLWMSAPWWVRLLFPGFDDENAKLCVTLARIQILSLPIVGIASLISAVHYARSRFVFVELCTFVPAILSVVLMYPLLQIYGIVAAAWLVLLRSGLQLAAQLSAIERPASAFGIPTGTRIAWSRAKPILAGNLFYKTDPVIDRYLLSTSAPGDISLLALAQQAYSAASSVIGKVWGSTSLPKLSLYFKSRDHHGFSGFYHRRLGLVLAVCVGIYLVILVIGEPMLNVALGHGKISGEDVHRLWSLMILLGGVFIFGCVGVILASAFYARGDTRTPTNLGVVTYMFFIIIKCLSYFSFGLVGIALAASAYYMISALLLYWLLPITREKKS